MEGGKYFFYKSNSNITEILCRWEPTGLGGHGVRGNEWPFLTYTSPCPWIHLLFSNIHAYPFNFKKMDSFFQEISSPFLIYIMC